MSHTQAPMPAHSVQGEVTTDAKIYAFSHGNPNSWVPVAGSAATPGGKTEAPKADWKCSQCRYCTAADGNFFHIAKGGRYNLVCSDCVKCDVAVSIFFGKDALAVLQRY